MNTKAMHVIAGVAIAALALLAAYNFFLKPPEQHVLGEVHEHADFKLFLNGTEFNFSQSQYMSEEPPHTSSGNVNGTSQQRMLSNFVHLHGLDGGVVHKHIRGVTMGLFFKSLGMVFNSTCLATGDGRQYCDGQGGKLAMIVNGRQANEFGNYEFHDLDRILVSFGSGDEAELQREHASVSDRACIQSLKCPERGTPTPEDSCAGAGGCAA